MQSAVDQVRFDAKDQGLFQFKVRFVGSSFTAASAAHLKIFFINKSQLIKLNKARLAALFG